MSHSATATDRSAPAGHAASFSSTGFSPKMTLKVSGKQASKEESLQGKTYPWQDRAWRGSRRARRPDEPLPEMLTRLMGTKNRDNLTRSLPNLHQRGKRSAKKGDFGLTSSSCLTPQPRKSTIPLATSPWEGFVRDIHVLGVIGDNIVCAFKGSGSLIIHLENVANGELVVDEGQWQSSYDKHLHGSKHYSFVECEVPRHLPINITIVGRTTPEFKPVHESRLRARISESGHVVSTLSFLAS